MKQKHPSFVTMTLPNQVVSDVYDQPENQIRVVRNEKIDEMPVSCPRDQGPVSTQSFQFFFVVLDVVLQNGWFACTVSRCYSIIPYWRNRDKKGDYQLTGVFALATLYLFARHSLYAHVCIICMLRLSYSGGTSVKRLQANLRILL